MRYNTRAPCKTCPYRKDVKTRVWDRAEFEKLLASSREQFGAIYACHMEKPKPPAEREVCGGWVLIQKKENIPSIQLRMALMRDPHAAACLNEITSGGATLYPSIKAMCRANGARARREVNRG